MVKEPFETRLPLFDKVAHRGGFGLGMKTHRWLVGMVAYAEGHDREAVKLWVFVKNPTHRLLEDLGVVYSGAHHDLAVHFDTVVEQGPKPAEARCPSPVSEQIGTDLWVGGMNTHVERAQALGDDTLEIGLGETGQRREVAVQKRQTKVVVFEVEALAHPRRKLVDKAERAVVVAGSDLVEQRAMDFKTERLARRLLNIDDGGHSTTVDLERDVGLINEEVIADDVTGLLSVDGQQDVANPNVSGRSSRFWSHRDYLREGHSSRIRRQRVATLFFMAVEKVLLCAPRGFCAGVEMAIKALAWLVRSFDAPVYCYHEIVHNKLVVDAFKEQGVIFVDTIDEVPPGSPIMLSAHGSAPEIVSAARERGSYVVDAVCPLVTKVHHEVKVRVGKGFRIIYVGHEGHEEAVGTMAVAPDSISRVESIEEVAALPDFDEPTALLAQTTLSHRDWSEVAAAAKERFPELWQPGRSDLCFATTNRQSALMSIASKCDAVVVIGSANSSNTNALAKLASEAGCANVFRVNGPGELPHDLKGVVGVTAGASAPEDVVQDVIDFLAPVNGVEEVRITDEDEYFPPPRNLRSLLAAIGTVASVGLGGSVENAADLNDRQVDASDVLALL